MELDLQQVAFADGAGPEAFLAEIHGFLKARQVGIGKLEVGLGQQNADELLRHVGRQAALVVAHLGARLGGLVARGLNAGLPLVPALKGVAEADVEFRDVVQRCGVKLAGLKMGTYKSS